MSGSERKRSEHFKVLDSQIRMSMLFALIALLAVPILYFFWFSIQLSFPLSQEPEVWGQFGDFFGGVLNPFVGFLAFLWLTRSIRLQMEELSLTRSALEVSSAAQLEMVDSQRITNRLSLLQSELSIGDIQLRHLQARLDTTAACQEDYLLNYLGNRVDKSVELDSLMDEYQERSRRQEELLERMLSTINSGPRLPQ